jgi:hypothetical protein|tara:strand:+ start:36037 stop:36270 length:234 start_codon:yes stop_codon:yes gene_type:complete
MIAKEIEKIKTALNNNKVVYYKFDGLYVLKRVLLIGYATIATFSGKPLNQQSAEEHIDLADECIQPEDFWVVDKPIP